MLLMTTCGKFSPTFCAERRPLQHAGDEVDRRVVCVVPAEGGEREARGARRVQCRDEEEQRAQPVCDVVQEADRIEAEQRVRPGFHRHPRMVHVRGGVVARDVPERDDDGEEDREDERSDPHGSVRWHCLAPGRSSDARRPTIPRRPRVRRSYGASVALGSDSASSSLALLLFGVVVSWTSCARTPEVIGRRRCPIPACGSTR